MIRLLKNFYSLPQKDLADHLVKNYPIYEIAETAAELLKERDDADKIIITFEQFRRYFKIKGVNSISFSRENRGRMPMSPKAIANAEKRDSELFQETKEDE